MSVKSAKNQRRGVKLEERERAFVRLVLAGHSQTEAARRAGYRGTDGALAAVGSRLAARPKIATELARIRALDDAKSSQSREARMAMLEDFARDSALEPRDRIKALELRAKMAGDFLERKQVELTGPAQGPVRIEIVMTPEQRREHARRNLDDQGTQSLAPGTERAESHEHGGAEAVNNADPGGGSALAGGGPAAIGAERGTGDDPG